MPRCPNEENASGGRSDGSVRAWTHHGKSEPILQIDSARGDEGLGYVAGRAQRTRIILVLRPHEASSRPRPSVSSSPRSARPTPDPLEVQLVHVLRRDLSRDSAPIRVSHHEWVHALRSLMRVRGISKHDHRMCMRMAAQCAAMRKHCQASIQQREGCWRGLAWRGRAPFERRARDLGAASPDWWA